MKKEAKIPLKELKHKARRKSIQEGIYSSIKESFGTKYISPFAIALNASSPLVAMLSSISGLFGPLMQTAGSKLMKKVPRKKILTTFVILEALVWLPMIILAALFYQGIITSILPFLLAFFFAIYISLNHIAHPAYFSWIGDIVDKKFRGRWLSKRTIIVNATIVICSIIAAIFLDKTVELGYEMFGFIVLFFIAFLARIKGYKIYRKEYFPELKLKKKDDFTFWQFLKQAPKTNFGKFAIFRSFLGLATSITSPLLAIYLLRELQFTYSIYMVVILAGTIFSIFVLAFWGKIDDKYGSYKILAITSILVPIIPILWILSIHPLYLILVASLIGGITWAGFDLAAKTFIYDNVSKPKRGTAISYYNLLVGIGVFFGASISALLIKFLDPSWIKPITLIFIIGGLLRGIVILFGIKRIKEVKAHEKLKGLNQLTHLILKEAKPALQEEIHDIISIKDYIREK